MRTLEIRVPAIPSSHLPEIDELKGVAILLIILYHAGGVLVWNNYFHGDVGVDMFFVLSGLSLALSSRQDTFKTFLWRRFVRLFPAYWLVLLAYVLCNQHFLQHHYSTLNIGAHVLGVHGFFGDSIGLAINDSFWFVSAIVFLYPCFYYLRPKLEELDVFFLVVGLLSATVALSLFFCGQAGLMGHVGFRLPGFFIGMVAGYLIRRGCIQIPLTASLGIGLAALAYVPFTRGITFYSAIVALSVIALYVWALRPLIAEQSGIRTVLAFLGRHSLEIFLIHQPLMRDYNYYLHGRWLNIPQPSPLSLAVGMAIALAVTLLAATELRRLQERFIKS